jgi:hypothetical protein
MATTAPATKKSSKGRKSAAIALAVVGVAGLSLASAAQLTVNSASLGAGTSVVASCEGAGTISVTYTNVYSAGAYNTSAVQLSGIAAACNGLKYQVQVQGTGGAALGAEATGTLPASGTTATVTLAVPQPAASILGVSVVIYG